VLHDARHVFALSEWTKQSIVDDFELDPSTVTVVYAGSNLKIDASLRQARHRREILFVGIDWERKGGPLLLEAFRIARKRLPDITLSIVGCSPRVHDAGVVVEGFLDRRNPAEFERLSRCYLRAACMCLPSLFDPFPNAIIEAATAGLPTVAIDNGSRREAVIDRETGILARSPDAEAIAEALVALLEDPVRCEAMGREARRRSEAFTWANVIARIGAVAAPPGSDAAPVARRLHPVA
jgi:glycosyltransferase involved in cell wall biosynthesis